MRPIIHYRPEANWINDPNGLCQVDGWYHLFYQYNPQGSVWGDMHWGHARSRDMYRWETLPIALIPDAARGEEHCFSGSCCKDETGRPHFFYTSIGAKEAGRDCMDGAQQWHAEPVDSGLTRLIQTEAGALTDAIHGGAHVRDWRDPCVIRYGDGYLMVLGGCLEGRGCILLYTSPDMQTWTYRHVLLQSDKADGVPWECPNLFLLDGMVVAFWSPCATVEYAVGTLDEQLRFHMARKGVLDPGEWQGYYAPQTFRDEQGRTILMGWMPECDGDAAAIRRGWSGVMSLPRLLSIKDDDLHAELLPGWETMADTPVTLALSAGRVSAQAGQHFILRMRCRIAETPLVIRFLTSPSSGEVTELRVSPDGEACLVRDQSTTSAEPCTAPIRRTVMLVEENDVFLCVDGTAVECMVNGRWLSGRVYPQAADAAKMEISSEAADVRLYPIRKA